jgi:hypothetical protein
VTVGIHFTSHIQPPTHTTPPCRTLYALRYQHIQHSSHLSHNVTGSQTNDHLPFSFLFFSYPTSVFCSCFLCSLTISICSRRILLSSYPRFCAEPPKIVSIFSYLICLFPVVFSYFTLLLFPHYSQAVFVFRFLLFIGFFRSDSIVSRVIFPLLLLLNISLCSVIRLVSPSLV